MSKFPGTIALLATLLLAAPSGALAEESYGEIIGLKLTSGFSNLLLGIVEVPKNIINTTNQTNVLFGITGGVMKGTIHALGRSIAGIVDIVSFPVPTKPITKPGYVWENFYTDTQYGPFMRVDNAAPAPMDRRYP